MNNHLMGLMKCLLLSSCVLMVTPVLAQQLPADEMLQQTPQEAAAISQIDQNADIGTMPIESMAGTLQDTNLSVSNNAVLDRVVVTGTSVATNIRNAPASISVLDQEQLQQKAAPDLTEMLRTVPGVNVGFGSDGTRGISMRGMGSGYTLILVDGKRVNAGLSTMRHYRSDLDWVPIDAIDRIEVVRGPMSTLYGSDALGGVINIITKKATDRWHGSITGEWIQPESDRTGVTKRVNGYISGPIVPDELSVAAYASGTRQKPSEPGQNEDIQLPIGSDNYDFNTTFTWTPTIGQMFEFSAGKGRDKYKPVLGEGEIDTSKTQIIRTTFSARHVGDWDFGTSTINAYVERAENKHNTTNRAGQITGDTEITLDTYTVDGHLTMPFTLGFDQDLTVGAEYRLEEMSDPENLGKFNTVTQSEGSSDTSMWTAAVFMEDQIKLTEMLKMTAGVRVDQHEEFGTHTSPRIYFNYDVNENLTFKAGWAQAFKAPNLRQLNPNWVQTSRGRGCGAVGGPCEMVGNPDLKPETSNSYEFGALYTNTLFDAGLTYFYNEIDDKITSARTATLITDAGTKFVEQVNVDRARTQGLEGSFILYPHPDWTWTNTATYLIESKNLETGMPLSADPEYSVHTEVSWKAREDLHLTGSWDFYGKQVDYVSNPETLVAQNVSAYNMAGFSVKYDPTQNFSMRAGINNLFDKTPKSESNYTEYGRSYFIALTSKF
ncbi:TonB-dependent receptor domain-containing protein [Bartonella tamiae]|uniref:TonB-dependent siderophore receptor n=1 Tax=Bartonella tamiae Th239 TaxID=1094558 RepID=J0R0T8_9HYPH|nr:TonB-dependent receptor [Bartonella tamiae]EJF89139.1 hypothetical protein ME5_01690 [Bartonella tamiae Th239]EJF95458.1 hypothetical protein MEG_00191 [Bartonella tamiae Th307]